MSIRSTRRARALALFAMGLAIAASAGCSSHQGKDGARHVDRTSITSTTQETIVDPSKLSFEKYTLANGLTVILHVDHSLPQATINLWYGVGARNESPGRSGFAHLFEHLMFMGTKRVPGSDFDNLMEAAGGSNNASTSIGRTNYFSSGPSSLLPTLLWLDADRLEDLGASTDEKKLNVQRDVVRNEIRQNVENTPYQRAYEASFRLMYPATHVYHNAVYGTHADLEAATVNDVRDFFSTYYTPENCSLVVAGDFDPATIKPLVEKLYGSIPRGNTPTPKPVPAGKIDHVERATFLDKVQLPQIEFVYHSPGYFTDGDAEMDIVGAILADGQNSRLYKRLVIEEQIATDVSAGQESQAETSLFRLTITAKPGADLTRIETEVDEEIAALQKDGPTAAELTQRKNVIELGKLTSLQALSSRADKLNEYQFYFGTPNGMERDLNRYRDATRIGIQTWSKKVLTKDARLVMTVLPESTEREPNGRDEKPVAMQPAAFAPPLPEQFKLSSGVNVALWTKPGVPLVSLDVVVAPGSPLEPTQSAGLASLTAEMTQQGAGDRDAVAFADAQQDLGATIDANANVESMTFSLTVLKRNIKPATALLADSMLRPRMTESDFERTQALAIDELEQALEEPRVVAVKIAAKLYFGDGSRFSVGADGTPKTVKAMTLNQARSFLKKTLVPSHSTVLIAGDITATEARALLEPIVGEGSWAGGNVGSGPAVAIAPETPTTPGLRLAIVDRPGATQTTISLLGPGVRFASEERAGLMLVNTILGGSFTSRLNQNLREIHGYTYGIGSGLNSARELGTFRVGCSVKGDVTGAALNEMLSELKRLGSGDLTEAEANKARETLTNNITEGYGTLRSIISQGQAALLVGASFDDAAKELKKIASTDLPRMRAMSSKLVDLDRSVLVLVGDRSKIISQLAPLNLPKPMELTVEGELK